MPFVKNSKIINRDMIKFYSLFLLTILSVYYAPPFINKLYFILLLALFWNSKKNYFWFAFVFILISQPAHLFQGGLATDMYRVPFYNITTGLSFDFFDLFFILAFLKALFKGKPTKLLLRKPLFFLLFYLAFLFIISFVHGINLKEIPSILRQFTVFTLFISFPYLIYRRENFFQFMHLIFPILFVIVISQFLELFTGNSLFSFLTKKNALSIIQLQEIMRYSDFVRLMPGGTMLKFFSFIFTLFLIEKKDYPGKKSYLYLILTLCFFSTFLSATRSWIVMFIVILSLYTLFVVKKRKRIFIALTVSILIIIFSYLLIPRLKVSIDSSAQRLSTIEYIIQGDVTAGGTLQRIDKRLPKVLEGFEQNPIFGWGFSKNYFKYRDLHVGTFNLLLQVGIVGLIFFVILWVNYFKMMFFTRRKLSINNPFKSSLHVLVIAFIGLLLLQFTTYAFFAYDLYRDVIYFTLLFLSISDFFVKAAFKEENYK